MDSARFTTLAAVAAAIAGCSPAPEPTEAERFGYRGEDAAATTALTFIVQSPTVTNWVPERVLSVVEQYEFSADELALVEAAATPMPAAEYAGFEGYAKTAEEPWFTTWSRDVEAFGFKGVAGIISHYNEDRRVWETSESYFSSYWPTREAALAAQARLREIVAQRFNPKKFYDFADCWLAEYVRLSVLCVVGQKADGNWSCMLDLRDKCSYGCGPYEDVDAQRERLAHYRYAKRRAAWRKQVAEVYARNHELVAAAAGKAGWSGAPEGAVGAVPPAGRPYASVADGECLAAEFAGEDFEANLAAAWQSRCRMAEAAFGAVLPAVGEARRCEENGAVWLAAAATNDLYDVRMEMLVPKCPAEPCEAACEAGEDVGPARWRILAIERLQPGLELPPEPQYEQ